MKNVDIIAKNLITLVVSEVNVKRTSSPHTQTLLSNTYVCLL